MDYLRNTWYLAGWSEQLAPGELAPTKLLDRPMVLARAADGTVAAMDDRCAHRSAPLSRGRFDGERIACGYHGLQFDLCGTCVHNPHGNGRPPRAARLHTYPVVERHGGIWVWPGDAEPDLSTLADFSSLDAEGVVTRRDHFVMPVPYDLIVDNLLDCSHTSFLHEGILGTAGMIGPRTQVEQSGTTINVIRTAEGVEPPGMFDMLFLADGQPVDTWTDFRWDPPSLCLLDVGVTRPGRPRSEGAGYLGTHILTPETATTTHYFTAATRWGIRPGTETEETRLKVSDLRRFAFEEQDAPMITAQYENLKAFPPDETRPVMLETDAGVIRWHRVFDDLLAAERLGAPVG